jgi:hypothetical protein
MMLLMLLALVRASFTDAATAAQCVLIAMCLLISRSFHDADADARHDQHDQRKH